jgi:hypothetical protein
VRRSALTTVLVAAALAGCAGGDEADQTAAPSTPAPAPSAATEAATATPTATATATPTATEQPLPSVAPEDQPGGAGDEEAIRVPAEFTVRDGGITPPQIAVPAFLSIELIVHNRSSQQVVVRLEGAEPMTVEAGGTGRARLEGRKKGSYVVDAGPAGQAVLLTGAEPGP